MDAVFQHVTLSPLAAVGDPGPLPAIFTGADPAGLLDLGWVPAEHGFAGQAFWPVIAEPVDFDPATEALTDEIGPVTLDAELQIATAIRGKRPLTEEEVAPIREQMRQQVYARRDELRAAGFDHDFGDIRGIHRIGTTPSDMEGWDEVTMGANALVALGQGGAEFTIDTNTGPTTVTALEWQAVLAHATLFRQPIWAHSFALLAAINESPAEDLAAIDLTSGWPS